MVRTAAPKVMWVGRARTLAYCLLVVLVSVSIGLILTADPALAAVTFTVDRTDDPEVLSMPIGGTCKSSVENDCSLRRAIKLANSTAGTDTVVVPASATPYTLTRVGADEDEGLSGDPDLLDVAGVVIQGAGAASTTMDAGGTPGVAAGIDRVFHVIAGSGTTSISGVTVKGGSTNYGSGGGGIYNGGTLTLTNSTVSANTAGETGGGIYNDYGTLTLDDSTVSGNTAYIWGGGGIGSYTHLVVLQTTITNSTISDNTASGHGGGIYNELSLTAIEHSTITNNTAPSGAGSGVASNGDFSTTSTEVLSTIISANTDTSVDSVSAPGTNTTNSFSFSFSFKGFNLIGDGNATLAFNQPGDQSGVANLALGLLLDNGGPTHTHAVQPGSPAVDAGSNTLCPTIDQRGETRPKDGDGNATATCDIGAFEKTPPPPNTALVARANSYSVREDAILRVPPRGVLANDSDANGDRLTARKVTNTRHGTLTLRADGSLLYNSKPNFAGVDTFLYKAFDGKALSNQAKVTTRVRVVAG